MTDVHEAFVKRFAPFKGRFELQPTSYQIRNPDGSPGGWIAQVSVWENEYDSSTVMPLWPTGSEVYPTEDDANRAALWGGLRWLEEGRPPVKQVS
ncbi:MAG TPA: hypothetical protein VHS78_17150 [Candidatus Elarobacter sp.]|jgi:hypothetical protein|nr:hypothetical protein [Candidatus Elarobacter sp.]